MEDNNKEFVPKTDSWHKNNGKGVFLTDYQEHV